MARPVTRFRARWSPAAAALVAMELLPFHKTHLRPDGAPCQALTVRIFRRPGKDRCRAHGEMDAAPVSEAPWPKRRVLRTRILPERRTSIICSLARHRNPTLRRPYCKRIARRHRQTCETISRPLSRLRIPSCWVRQRLPAGPAQRIRQSRWKMPEQCLLHACRNWACPDQNCQQIKRGLHALRYERVPKISVRFRQRREPTHLTFANISECWN
jgi:hypothetical protein